MRQLFRELKRRNVYKVAVAYVTVAFVGFQAAKLLIPSTVLPPWTDEFFLFLLIIGFPVALVVAWAFEMTPEGVRRTGDAEGASEPESMSPEERRPQSSLAMQALVGLGLVGAAVVGGWYLMGGGGEREPEPGAGDRSIAVLPFENMGGEESEQFTQGVHDGLLTRLSNISDLKVISRTSVMQYEGTGTTVPQIARELGAQWVVEGAVQQAGGEVQVNAQLIQARDDSHQWAETYRRELNTENLFALQGELTKKIARSLEAEISSGEQERVERHPTDDLTAYQLYVQGRQQLARRRFGSLEHIEEAVQSFRRAIERDSSFALAWAGLADAAAFYPSEVPDTVVAPDVSQESAARRALELDPDLAEAHASMGHVHLRNMDAPAARRELQRAINLKPSYWEAHHWLGELYLKIGRAEQALDHLELAVELNPQHALARHWLYDAYLGMGQPRKSIEEARRQRRMGLEEGSAIGGEVRALMALGQFEQARQIAEEQVADREVGNSWGNWFRAYLAEILAAQGDTVGALKYVDELRAADAHPRYLAWAYAGLGRTEQALETYGRLERADWAHIGPSHHLRYWQDLLSLDSGRDDPRYRKLIREANRAWGLNPDGSLPDSVDVAVDAPPSDE